MRMNLWKQIKQLMILVLNLEIGYLFQEVFGLDAGQYGIITIWTSGTYNTFGGRAR